MAVYFASVSIVSLHCLQNSSGLVAAWEYDSSSGYYYDENSGIQYDPKSGFYYSGDLGKGLPELFFLFVVEADSIIFLANSVHPCFFSLVIVNQVSG